MAELSRDRVPVRREYVSVPHGQVHLRRTETDASTRPALVCLHMSPASGLVYERLMAALGASRLVLAPDTPGFGASDPLPPQPDIPAYATVMAQVIEALELPAPVDLLGYHTGSLISVELARQRPDLVRRIVAVSMPVFTEDELVGFRRLYDRAPLFTEDGERLLARWRWFVDFFGVGTHNTVEDAARIFLARLSGGERHWWGHHAAFAYDVPAALATLDTPLLILNPDDDLTTQTRRAEGLAPHGRIVEVPQWTHGFMDTHTEEAAAFLVAHLDADAW